MNSTIPNHAWNVWYNFLDAAAKVHEFPWRPGLVDDASGKGTKQYGIVDAAGNRVAFANDYADAKTYADFANAEFA